MEVPLTYYVFGCEIDADAFILRIRVWWSGVWTMGTMMAMFSVTVDCLFL
jgi:hypothetical protein